MSSTAAPRRVAGLALLLAMALLQHGLASEADAATLLRELVEIRSATPHGNVPAVAALLIERFKSAGFADADMRTLTVDTGKGETTMGLVLRYRAPAASARPIALLGHMDVVDADAAVWASDPFKLTLASDGYWYGRGTADNKGPIAAIAGTLIALKQSGWAPQRDILLVLSGDEESGSRTTQALVRDAWVAQAEYAINGDVGEAEVDADGRRAVFGLQVAEKTSVSFKVSSRNRGGHSSAPRADNALYDMADAIQALRELHFPVRITQANKDMVQGLSQNRGGEEAAALARLLADPADQAARKVMERYPEDAHVLWTTCVPTMINGGSARNALPQSAEMVVHCRIFPGDSTQDVQQALIAAIDNPRVLVEVDAARGSSAPSPPRADVFDAARKALRTAYPDAELRTTMSSGGSDGRYFRQAGIPTYGLNPMADVRPVSDRAHGIDERLRVASFNKALVFWDALLRQVAVVPRDKYGSTPQR